MMDVRIIFSGVVCALPRDCCSGVSMSAGGGASSSHTPFFSGVDAVGVVAFAYDAYTNPANDNGCSVQHLLFCVSGGGARGAGKGVPWLLGGSVLGQAGG